MRQSISVRTNLDPPQPEGQGRAFALALLAHLLLILALAWGLHWKKDVQDMAVEAELWAATAQTAAPKAAPAVPPPPPQPVVPPRPAPEPKPAPPVDDSKARQAAELALEQQKKREEAQRQAEIQKRKDEQRKAEEEKRKQAQRQEERRAQAKAEADRKAAEQRAQAIRQANIIRMTALATSDQSAMVNPATGQGRTPSGSANREAGPSAGYEARVRTAVLPNIAYPSQNSISGNPGAEVEVSASLDGTIIGRRLIKPSGVPSWDAAVLRAIDKTRVMPRDVDGRVPSPITIVFTPHQ